MIRYGGGLTSNAAFGLSFSLDIDMILLRGAQLAAAARNLRQAL